MRRKKERTDRNGLLPASFSFTDLLFPKEGWRGHRINVTQKLSRSFSQKPLDVKAS